MTCNCHVNLEGEKKQEARNNRDFTVNQSAYKHAVLAIDVMSQIKYFLAQHSRPNFLHVSLFIIKEHTLIIYKQHGILLFRVIIFGLFLIASCFQNTISNHKPDYS